MIVSVKDKRIAEIMSGRVPSRFPPDLMRSAQKAVRALEAAERIEDLRLPPSNRLEALRGNRAGQWSIRINLQWRLCFRWGEGGAEEVEIVDYH
jgi:proteic killer suppression protein